MDQELVVKPHKDLGRAGTICPFVPGSLERKTLWLAPEQIAERDGPQVVELMSGYKRLLLDTRPTEGDDVIYNVIVVVFADLSADRPQGVFDDVLKQLAVPSYVQDGIVFGPFYEGNERTAIYNAGFRPFQSPVPFLFVRHGVISDWKFFLDNGDWLNLWGRRFGESAVHALAEELRRSRGGWGATNPKVASRRKEHLIPPTGGPEGTLAGVARWVGRNRDLVPGARSSTRVMPVPNHPAASACTLKFSRVYSHRTIAGGIGHNLPQEAPEAFADAVLQAGGRGT